MIWSQQNPSNIYHFAVSPDVFISYLFQILFLFVCFCLQRGTSDTTVHLCRLYTFKACLKEFMPKTYHVLHEMGGLDYEYLNLMFVDLFRELVMEEHVLTIMDAYLLEGWRVLLRYALAFIKIHKSLIKSKRFKRGKELWAYLRSGTNKVS